MGFNAERVESGIKRLLESQQKRSQQRMDSFFKPVISTTSASSVTDSKKRKAEPTANSKTKAAFARKR